MNISNEIIICPRCSSTEYKIMHKAKDYLYKIDGEFTISKCKICGLWYQNPRPLETELHKLYPDDYTPYQNKPVTDNIELKTQPSGILPGIKRSLKHVLGLTIKRQKAIELEPDFIPNGKLIEIGCAEGSRLLQLKQEGWEGLFGIELSELATKRACLKGLNVECGLAEDLLSRFPDNYFDVVISSMVLEHLVNPFSVVKVVTKKLKPGGQFLFSTINRKSIDAKIYKKFWAGFDLPRHMVYFSKTDLRNTLKDDYQEVKIYGQIAPVDFLRSSQWRFEEKKKRFDKFILSTNQKNLYRISLFLAILNLTTRISVRSTKKKN